MRVCAHDQLERLGGLTALGRRLAAAGERRGLLFQVAAAEPTPESRLEVTAQHRLWAATVEAEAARSPIAPPARGPGERIRLGFLSCDLRYSTVGVFAWPLFEHRDPRFELFAYSPYPGPGEAVRDAFAERCAAYRSVAGLGPRAVAEAIAADGLDVLVEIGGPQGWNVPEALAWRPAPLQASWMMGHPTSVGLAAVDRVIIDPQLAPADPAHLLERPLVLPRTWVSITPGAYFQDEPRPAAETPEARNGWVTFGTMNASYKYSPRCLDLWARTVAAVPGSRFLIVRPEAAAPAFRENVERAFAARGVAPERLGFEAVRGQHLPWYDAIDITLDSLPVTGGTTTCECLWMGTPVVTLAGEAPFERVSRSLLVNAGLADLVATDEAGFVEIAVGLARDRGRRAALKQGLRAQITAHPLGRPEEFARDFYEAIAAAVAEERPVRPAMGPTPPPP
jgi:predicted O-linked N-acetylglucosamine transferase (SPINDLY family)